MANTAKKEFVPKSIYVTNQPVVVLTLEQLEKIYGLHITYQERDKLTIQQQQQFDAEMKAIHRELRREVVNARHYFKIQSVRNRNKAPKCIASTESK
ncbi:hypothetical protein FAES_1830 [Fibrella aestuarina BUZ 2]|uniref:Uncharacterized protein n=1 Tax=Fibrella aestuarina BUZ 2 TaxID=1166018 RepID=I0K6T7_9BACT|nr:hypothetical protein [Fibrella aestuarina]CCG99840.1 hypothetical protein FAES_1830 [Fibrella aestuarina BUZ 2]